LPTSPKDSTNLESNRRVEPFVADMWRRSEDPRLVAAPLPALLVADRWQAVAHVPPSPRPSMHTMTDADSELVLRAQRRDRTAFEELVRRHADRLYAVVLRFLGNRHEARR
jgi:hypothetical protein